MKIIEIKGAKCMSNVYFSILKNFISLMIGFSLALIMSDPLEYPILLIMITVIIYRTDPINKKR